MPINAENLTLLEYLAQRLGCAYLSDLHFAVQTVAFRREIESLSPDRFPQAQWREAYQYLVGPVPPGAEAQALLQGLLECCRKGRGFKKARAK